MLKKSLWIALVLAGVLVLGVAGVTLAQDTQPPVTTDNSCTCDCYSYGGRGGHGGMKGFGRGNGSLVSATAEVTGLSEDKVTTALQEGQTIAQIAEGAGKKASDIVEALVAERKADLDEAVKAGKLTQKQADLMVELMRETLTQQVAKTWTAGSGTMLRGGGLMGSGMLRGGGKFHGGGWQTQP